MFGLPKTTETSSISPAALELADRKIGEEGPSKVAKVTPATPLGPDENESSSEVATQSTISSLSLSVSCSEEKPAGLSFDGPEGKIQMAANIIYRGLGRFGNTDGVDVTDIVTFLEPHYADYYAAFVGNPRQDIVVPPLDVIFEVALHPDAATQASAGLRYERFRAKFLRGDDSIFDVSSTYGITGRPMKPIEVIFVSPDMLEENLFPVGQSYKLHLGADLQNPFGWVFYKVWRLAVNDKETLRQACIGHGDMFEATFDAAVARLEKLHGRRAQIIFGMTNQLDDKFIVPDIIGSVKRT
jgi:hypothetical protein